jgi:hypothetical protein
MNSQITLRQTTLIAFGCGDFAGASSTTLKTWFDQDLDLVSRGSR